MTKDEALDLALEALTPFSTPNWAGTGVDKANEAITAIKQARSAKQERHFCERCGKRLGDYIHTCTPPAAPMQDSTCNETLRAQGKAYPRTCRKCGLGPCIGLANAALDKKAENARELGLDYEPAEWLTGCPECGMDSGCDCDSGTWNPPATQRQWVGLTEQDIGKACGFAEHTTDSTRFALKAISRAIEAKLKELNT